MRHKPDKLFESRLAGKIYGLENIYSAQKREKCVRRNGERVYQYGKIKQQAIFRAINIAAFKFGVCKMSKFKLLKVKSS